MKLWCRRYSNTVVLENADWVATHVTLEHEESDPHAAVEAAISLAREGATVPFDRDHADSYDFGPAHLRWMAHEGLREVAGDEIDKVLVWTREDIINNVTVED
jgi:hypothetical protein